MNYTREDVDDMVGVIGSSEIRGSVFNKTTIIGMLRNHQEAAFPPPCPTCGGDGECQACGGSGDQPTTPECDGWVSAAPSVEVRDCGCPKRGQCYCGRGETCPCIHVHGGQYCCCNDLGCKVDKRIGMC